MTARHALAALSVAALTLLPSGANATPGSYFVLANGAIAVDAQTSIARDVSQPMAGSHAAANLALGQLEASAFYGDIGNGSGASAEFGDTLTILGVVAPTNVTVTLHVIGGVFALVDGIALIAYGNGGFDCSGSDCDLVGSIVNSRATVWSQNGDTSIDRTIKLTIPVSPADSTFSLVGYLSTSIEYGSGDFQAFISLALPAGLSFESASGVFLAPVPEPSTFALMGSGLLALVACSRRGRRRVTPTIP